MPKPNSLEVCRVHLFDDVQKLSEYGISEQLIERIKRIRSAYTLWISYPLKKDKEIRDHLVNVFGIVNSTAYEDIQIIKHLLGDLNETPKSYIRFKITKMFENAYDLAEKKRNPLAMVAAGDKIGKYNKADQEDAFDMPWDEIVPQPFEPSSDPEIIGIKPVPNIREKIASLKKKYETDLVEDIDFEEVDSNFETLFNPQLHEVESIE